MINQTLSITARVLLCMGLAYPAFAAEPYVPKIDPAKFTTEITNPYLSLPVGRTLFYLERTEDGDETVQITITGETREVMGVKTLVYLDRVYLEGVLIEHTKDFLAQNIETGDVWYFGEEVDNYNEHGVFKDHAGAWLAGVNGAQPGIWVKAHPMVGEEYRQEYYVGEAEDMARVKAVGVTVNTGLGTFSDCQITFDFTPLNVDSREEKTYCKGVGAVVHEANLKDGNHAELIKIGMLNR